MYTKVSDKYKLSNKSYSIISTARISIVGENKTIDSTQLKDLTLKDFCYDEQTGELIGTNMAKVLEFTFQNKDNISLADKEISLELGLVFDWEKEEREFIPIGNFTVTEYEDLKSGNQYKVLAYDYMTKFNSNYKLDESIYPCTLKEFYYDLCKKYGMKYKEQDKIPNENFRIETAPALEGMTGRSILRALGQLFGRYAKINRDNQIEWRLTNEPNGSLYPSTHLYSSSTLYPRAKDKQLPEAIDGYSMNSKLTMNNRYGPINSVTLSMSQVNGENVTLEDTDSIKKYGECSVNFEDNPFVYTEELREKAIQGLYSALHGFTYIPVEFNYKGRFYLDCGDLIRVENTQTGEIVDTVLLNHTIKVPATRTSSISSKAMTSTAVKTKYISQSKQANTRTEINVYKNQKKIEEIIEENTETSEKLNDTIKTIDETNSKISSVETKVEKAQTTADNATDKANNAQSTADNATDKAENAQSTADSATSKAENAQSTADSATDKANNAQTTADNINDNLSKNYYTKKQVEETSTISQTVKGLTETAEKYEKQIDPDTGEIVAETGDLANLKITSNELSTSVTSLEKSSISNVDVEYALGTSNTTAPTSGWSAKAPDWEQGKYMWQRTKTTYANNSQKISEATCISGAKGEKGDKGSSPTLTSITNYYLAGISSTTEPTGTWVTDTTKSGFSSTNKYLWSYEVVKFSTGSTTSPKTMIGTWGEKGEKGDQGIQGIQGVKGDDGVTYYTYFAYGTDDNGTDFSKTPTSSTTYQGVCITTSSTQPTDPTKYTWYLTKGNTGDTGAKGDKGDDGITRYTYFAYGTSNSGANFSTSPTTSSTYIGICTTTSSTQPTTPSSYKWSLTKGNTGNGIKSITEYYQVSTSNKAEPTTWNTSIPTLTSTNKYLWNYEIITYTDNTTSSTSKRVIGVYGDDGTGIREIVEQYYLSSSNTEQKDGSWNTTQPTWTQGKYIWTRSKVTWTSGTTTYTTPVLANSINKANETAKNANDTANDTVKNFGTYITQNAESVKLAWNQISDFIQMMIINNNASFAILDSNQKVMMALDKTGQHFYKDDGKTVFGEMGVQKIDNQNYISFAVDGDYEKDIDNGMAWGIKTTDNKFFPILYIKDFHMGSKNGDIGTGKLVLEACDIVIDTNAGIIADNIKIHGDAMPGLFFENTDTSETLLSIIPGNNILSTYDTINILDKISFFKNQANSNTLQIGGTNGCSLTDDGSIICKTETVDGYLSCGSLSCQSLLISDGNEVSSIDANGKVVGHFNFSGLPSYQGNLLVYGEGHKYHLEWDSSKLKFYVDVTNVANLSDKRLKDDIKEVPDNFIQAVGDCKTYQFKPKNRGGKIYVGLIAQELIDNYKKYKVEDYEQYGVLYESNYSSDKPDELYYFLDYEQYATIRCRYLELKLENQQKDIDFLKEEIKKLKRGD